MPVSWMRASPRAQDTDPGASIANHLSSFEGRLSVSGIPVLAYRRPGRDTSVLGGVTVPVAERNLLDLDTILNVEHPAYVQALERLAKPRRAVVHELPGGGDTPDRTFVRDVLHVADDTVFVSQFESSHRQPELGGIDQLVIDEPGTYPGIRCCYHKVIKLNGRSKFEGGNSFWLRSPVSDGGSAVLTDHWIAGLGVRGNTEGLDQIRPHLDGIVSRRRSRRPIKLVAVETDQLHITSVVTPIGDNAVLLNPAFADPAPFERLGTRVLLVPEEDRYSRRDPSRASLAGNVFWLKVEGFNGPDGIIAHSGYAATVALLRQEGYEVEAVPLDNITECLEGGPDCMALKLMFRCPLDSFD